MLKPFGDQIMVKLDSAGQFGDVTKNKETGIVVAVPDVLPYLGFHSFAFEASFGDKENLKAYQKYYAQLVGMRVYWSSTQERGSVFEDARDGVKYAFLKLTDILCADDADAPIAINSWDDKGGTYSA